MKRANKCVGKVAYSHKSQCITKILRLYETRGQRLRYYECPTCLDFHLTSKNADEQFKQIIMQRKKKETLINVQNRERNIVQKQAAQIAHSKKIIQSEWVKFCHYFQWFHFKLYGCHEGKKKPKSTLRGILPRAERLRILATMGTQPVDKLT